MNKLLTDIAGGYPFILDDLRFVDDSIREVLKAPFSFLKDQTGTNNVGNTVWISPVFYDDIGNNVEFITPGQTIPDSFMYYNGELWFVPEFECPTGATGQSLIFREQITYSNTPPGTKTFLNGEQNETYQIRRGEFYVGAGDFQTPKEDIDGVLVAIFSVPDFKFQINTNYLYRFQLNEQTGFNQFKADFEDYQQNIATVLTQYNTRLNDLETQVSTNTDFLSGGYSTLILNNSNCIPESNWTSSDGDLNFTGELKYKKTGNLIHIAIQLEMNITNQPNIPTGLIRYFEISIPNTILTGVFQPLASFQSVGRKFFTTDNSNRFISSGVAVYSRPLNNVIRFYSLDSDGKLGGTDFCRYYDLDVYPIARQKTSEDYTSGNIQRFLYANGIVSIEQ